MLKHNRMIKRLYVDASSYKLYHQLRGKDAEKRRPHESHQMLLLHIDMFYGSIGRYTLADFEDGVVSSVEHPMLLGAIPRNAAIGEKLYGDRAEGEASKQSPNCSSRV